MSFVNVMAALRHWLLKENIQIDEDGPIRLTIEAPTPRVAAAMLYVLRREFDAMMPGPYPLDFGRPAQIMGMEVEFRIRGGQPMPQVYWNGPLSKDAGPAYFDIDGNRA